MRLSRRHFLNVLAAAALSLPSGGLYARFIEPERLVVKRTRLALRGMQRPLRLVQLTDLHRSEVVADDYLRRAVAVAIAERPDLICLTGDYVTGGLGDSATYQGILRPLRETAPVFAVLGNHDAAASRLRVHNPGNSEPVDRFIREAGAYLLMNERVRTNIGGQDLEIAGVEDYWTGACAPSRCLPETLPAAPLLFLAHNPDTKILCERLAFDLMLCGHTHGGQVWLPFVGGAYFAPVEDKAYVSGLLPWRDRLLYISRGVGNLHGIRFLCPPEVTVIDLVPPG